MRYGSRNKADRMPTAVIKDQKMRWFKRLIAAAVLSMSTVLAGVGASYGQDRVVHIGFQKYGKLVLLKSKGSLEPRLKALGYSVTWIEFPSGPPLLEAIMSGRLISATPASHHRSSRRRRVRRS